MDGTSSNCGALFIWLHKRPYVFLEILLEYTYTWIPSDNRDYNELVTNSFSECPVGILRLFDDNWNEIRIAEISDSLCSSVISYSSSLGL